MEDTPWTQRVLKVAELQLHQKCPEFLADAYLCKTSDVLASQGNSI